MKEMNTDKAWNNLHNRIAEADLIPSQTERTGSSLRLYQWAAAACILLILAGGYAFFWNNADRRQKWITQQNKESDNTLVAMLDDASIIYLGENATVMYPEEFEADKREIRVEGNLMLDIHPDPARPFFVETSHALVEVLGTAFRIQSDRRLALFELSVSRGKVKVTDKLTGQSMEVEQGETVQLNSGYLHKEQSTIHNILDEYTQKMSFKDEKLGNIIHVINESTDRPILLEKGLESRNLTVAFDQHSSLYMARLISLALQLNYTETPDSIYITH